MNRLLKNTLLLTFCFSLSLLGACSKKDNNSGGGDTITLVSTNPEENTIIATTTGTITFVFDQAIYVVDKTKITLNEAPVSSTSVNGKSLNIGINSLAGGTDYTLLIDKGALKDSYNNLNKEAFSLKFKTKEVFIGGSVSQHGFLSVKGTTLVDKDGKDIVLHGVSLGWHNWWPRFYNANTVAWLNSDWKCSVLRAAIGVDPSTKDGYLANPTFALNCLYTVVDAAIKNDMYVIVDWHTESIYLDEAKIFFQTVAEKYKDRPNLIYELYNEPNGPLWPDVKAYAEEVIGAIRAIAPKNIILVGSPQWDQALDKPAADPIKDYDNLMYTLHFYAATHGQWLRDVATAALQKGLPIFVTECGGMESSGNGPINQTEWQAWIQWMSANEISWAAWSLSDKNETCSMIKDTSSPVSGWTDNDLKQWGQIVRTELRK